MNEGGVELEMDLEISCEDWEQEPCSVHYVEVENEWRFQSAQW